MHQVGSSSCNTRDRPFQRPRCSDSSRRKDPRQARVTIQIHQIASYPWKRDCSGPALSPHENLSPAGHQLRPSIMAIRHNPFAEIFEVRVEPPIFRSTSRVTNVSKYESSHQNSVFPHVLDLPIWDDYTSALITFAYSAKVKSTQFEPRV